MRFISFFQALWSRIGPTDTGGLQGWRNWFNKAIILLSIFILPIVLSPSFFVFLTEGRYGLIAFDLGVWLLFIFRFFFVSQKSNYFNALLWLMLLYTMTVTFFVELGPHYARSAWLVMCTVMATLNYGVRGTFVATVFNAGILLLLYWFISPQNPAWAGVFNDPLRHWIMFVVNVSTITLVSGLPVGFLLDWLDRSLKQKQESEAKYRLLAENATDVIFTLSLESMRFTYVSPSILQMGGYTAQEILELTLDQRISPESLEQAMKVLEEELAKESEEGVDLKRSRTLVLQQLNKDGAYSWAEATMSFIRNAEGLPVEVLGVTRDISERKRAEEALRESQELSAKLIAAIPDIVVRTDMKGQILYLNDVALKISGYNREEIEGRILQEFVAPEDRERIIENLNIMLDHPLGPQEYHLVMKDGRKVPFEVNGGVLRHPDGSPYGTVNVCRDISERKQAEEEKFKLLAQVIQAQKMESIGTLAGGVAHDFNNLLTTIQGYAELASLSLGPENPLCESLTEIQKASKRAANLTRQLLLFSRKQPMDIRSLNLNDLLNNLMKMLGRLIGEDVTIQTELSPDLRTISGDSGNIEQIIMNLVVNARDAMPDGGTISIKTENVHIDREYSKHYSYARPGLFVSLSITDTGQGMDQDTIQQIFDPFFTTKELGRGTGLGLSVVYGIIKQHQGWVNVYSEPGQGSVFKVYFPVSKDPVQDEMATEAVSLQALQGNGERILVVEDDAGIQYFVEALLSKNGYRVWMARDAEEALGLFQQEKSDFDLVLSDVVLPGKSGLLLIEELLARNPELKIILSSGYADQKSQYRVIQEKGYPFIQKPYRLFELLKFMKEAIGNG